MNDNHRRYFSHNEPPKRTWIVQKLPIKGGNVLRSAMTEDCFRCEVKWIEIEGKIRS